MAMNNEQCEMWIDLLSLAGAALGTLWLVLARRTPPSHRRQVR